MKKAFAILLSLFVLTACTAVDDSAVEDEVVEDEMTVDYADMDSALAELLEIEGDWQMAVMRGDGESAPTYSEFMLDMGGIADDLRDLDEQYKLPEDLHTLIGELTMSLMRGDAELAPSYEEALKSATEDLSEFSALLDEMQ